jgi:hypothetical protein
LGIKKSELYSKKSNLCPPSSPYLDSITIEVSNNEAADISRVESASIAVAKCSASGSSHRIAIIAEESRII